MGDFNIRRIANRQDRNLMYSKALQDIEAFELMLRENMFDTSGPKIGAEQELCLVGEDMHPSTVALKALDQISDDHFTNELALYNMEINLDPLDLGGQCFTTMEKDLLKFLNYNSSVLSNFNTYQVLTGILPTLQYEHLNFANITPEERYKTLSDELAEIRGENFQIHVQGIDEIIMSLDSVLFEACNTSFQLHLQIHPDEFVRYHNWSQMISGPVLSTCVNSPLLFGNELWAETRIAIFKQSLDTRSAYKHLRKKMPRVYFGNTWLEKSPIELWKNDLMRFPLLLTADGLEDSLETLKMGDIPKLKGIRLHNGTTYTWNRMCYGHSNTRPHLRIECRYIPSGPTAIDEMANMALWIGLMKAVPQGRFWNDLDFKPVKDNFIKAARTGLHSILYWNGKYIPAKKLLLEKLVPLAYKGLEKSGVDTNEATKYLAIITKRLEKENTGADWLRRNFRNLSKKWGKGRALRRMVREMITYQDQNIPVHDWNEIIPSHSFQMGAQNINDIMSQDIISINQENTLKTASKVMQWQAIHHLPIEDNNGDLIGILTDGIVNRSRDRDDFETLIVRNVMISDPIAVSASDKISEVSRMMEEQGLSGVPVVMNEKLIGIVTRSDMVPE